MSDVALGTRSCPSTDTIHHHPNILQSVSPTLHQTLLHSSRQTTAGWSGRWCCEVAGKRTADRARTGESAMTYRKDSVDTSNEIVVPSAALRLSTSSTAPMMSRAPWAPGASKRWTSPGMPYVTRTRP